MSNLRRIDGGRNPEAPVVNMHYEVRSAGWDRRLQRIGRAAVLDMIDGKEVGLPEPKDRRSERWWCLGGDWFLRIWAEYEGDDD